MEKGGGQGRKESERIARERERERKRERERGREREGERGGGESEIKYDDNYSCIHKHINNHGNIKKTLNNIHCRV